ncbi:peroxide stress protein YaaA [Corynebacterium cystitidis]|uniref:Uncharacterized protein n=1 Tax=Corynebacterium cystitidis DSM 20524 TaxID=1121357 RepID=A0A1H9P0U7_9CORY|nr:peroxide stress protein YaaA [Corynebacterium cystitidis]WJY82657.1 hypothetical protein CCYS_08705 [Corynebacterium cystitidis DSM 20524]SER41856.1 hypothetical protein SAMN05661109_00176 [Corynebacterium cystitidis DSM 20524]SNV72205.1 Protein of uncharacterised function (DUF328) [Corynebacterium cystitidis]
MLIVLPPSETKAPGGESDPMDVSFPTLDPVREEIIADLAALPVDAQLAALKISERQRAEAEANLTLATAPVMPAIYRYTGVLYDALQADSLSDEALKRLTIGSALFGVVRADDMIPKYRLSAGSKIPRVSSFVGDTAEVPTMKARWRTLITEALQETGGFIVDLRSGPYQQLGKVPEAMTVRVEAVQPDGSRKVVSHFNKFYKGELARLLASAPRNADSIEGVADIAEESGLNVEVTGSELTLVVKP